MDTLPKNRFLRFCTLMVRRYMRHNVGIQSAALAFYLLFMIFPFLIFVSALLGLLQLNLTAILLELERFLPGDIVSLLRIYLTYVASKPSRKLMVFGLIFSIYFPMRATNSLMRSVRTAYHLGPPRQALVHWVKVLLYTILLIVTIILTLVLMTVGEHALLFATERFAVPGFIAELWARLRFPVVGVAAWFALFALYALAQDGPQELRNLWPGAIAALMGWLAISWLYAYYVDHIASYASLYGSIGTVIVLMSWLSLSATTMIMGAEWNGTLMSLRKESARKTTPVEDETDNQRKMKG